MDIIVNGEPRSVEAPLTVGELLHSLEVAPRGVAVLLNGEVARRTDWARLSLHSKDEVEIVRATAGG